MRLFAKLHFFCLHFTWLRFFYRALDRKILPIVMRKKHAKQNNQCSFVNFLLFLREKKKR